MNDCLFCKIIEGTVPSSKIYEDEYTYAFLDTTPVNKGHVLVVPKEHSTNIYDASEEALCAMLKTVKKLVSVVKKAVDADGINIHMNNESAAGQVISHAHFHVIPRFLNDGRRLWKGEPYIEDEMETVAKKITDLF